jgi:hypothetical protein
MLWTVLHTDTEHLTLNDTYRNKRTWKIKMENITFEILIETGF